jgi:hypothetical protein
LNKRYELIANHQDQEPLTGTLKLPFSALLPIGSANLLEAEQKDQSALRPDVPR